MNFNLSEEQNMLKDSVARFVQDEYDFESRRENAAKELGFNPDNWNTFAELGWLSIPFEEKHGGFGGGATDVMAVMEEMGKGLVVEPFIATVLMFGGLLNKSGNEALQDAHIEKIIDGSLQGAFGYLERQSRFELADVKTQAKLDGSDFVLNGEKTVVANGAAANKIVVSARTSGEQFDEAGITLFLIDTEAAGVERTTYRLMDGQVVANIKLTDELEMKFDFGNDDENTEPVDFTGQVSLGKCPQCSQAIYEHGMHYICEKSIGPERTCSFKTGKIILERPIEREQVTKLLDTGKTDLLTKFISKKGRPFSAYLVRNPDGKIGFEFEQKKPTKKTEKTETKKKSTKTKPISKTA